MSAGLTAGATSVKASDAGADLHLHNFALPHALVGVEERASIPMAYLVMSFRCYANSHAREQRATLHSCLGGQTMRCPSLHNGPRCTILLHGCPRVHWHLPLALVSVCELCLLCSFQFAHGLLEVIVVRERDHLYWYIIDYVAPTISTDRK